MTSEPRRLGWTTDIHLNFVSLDAWEAFVNCVRIAKLDGLLITGDISESEDVCWQLQRIVEALDLPIYFVLGNHDFYHGSVVDVRDRVHALCDQDARLHYLTSPTLPGESDATKIEKLVGGWVLCGDDGWADARVGDYFGTPVRMNDFRLIDDIANLSSEDRRRKLRRLGAEAAWRLDKQLRLVSQHGERILVLTHVPPFRESCWYEGGQTNDEWAPFFVCGAVGWILKRFCARHPRHQVLVLCGHTHHAGRAEMMDNLQVWTGGAQYGVPKLWEILDLDRLSMPTPDWSFRTSHH